MQTKGNHQSGKLLMTALSNFTGSTSGDPEPPAPLNHQWPPQCLRRQSDTSHENTFHSTITEKKGVPGLPAWENHAHALSFLNCKHISPAFFFKLSMMEKVRRISPSLMSNSVVWYPCLFYYDGHKSGFWSHDVSYAYNAEWQESAHGSEPET